MRRKTPKTPFLGVIALIVIILGIGMFFRFSKNFGKNQEMILSLENNLFLEKTGKTIESPKLSLIQENSISGVSCSQIFSSKVLGILVGEEDLEEKKEITEYIVQSGDTISSIAENFNISVNTILWANDLTKSSTLKLGQKLIILPVSGTFHHVKDLDTVSEVAQTYKAKTSDIVAFNELKNENDIYVGDILIIPNGTKPAPPVVKPTEYVQIPIASSYFIVPVASPYSITQGLHWYNAIDFGNNCGRPVFAAAGGAVLNIKYGYNAGAGNYIRILHPNGLITHYGHLQSILVKTGESVSQGDLIGLIGNTGRTIGATGCHLHFGLYSKTGNPPRNPFAK